jgi:hypothetical protein
MRVGCVSLESNHVQGVESSHVRDDESDDDQRVVVVDAVLVVVEVAVDREDLVVTAGKLCACSCSIVPLDQAMPLSERSTYPN